MATQHRQAQSLVRASGLRADLRGCQLSQHLTQGTASLVYSTFTIRLCCLEGGQLCRLPGLLQACWHLMLHALQMLRADFCLGLDTGW